MCHNEQIGIMKRQYNNPRTERVELDPLMVQFGGTQGVSIDPNEYNGNGD